MAFRSTLGLSTVLQVPQSRVHILPLRDSTTIIHTAAVHDVHPGWDRFNLPQQLSNTVLIVASSVRVLV